MAKDRLICIGLGQVGLFAAAWFDLSLRRPESINGSKKAWRFALFLVGIGPLAYYLKARKQSEWSEANVPDMGGKVAIVTGANSGIGYETARVLAQKGATVILACRSVEKGERAAKQIEALGSIGRLQVMALDLSDLESVRSFAAAFQRQYRQLDLLINNAGMMIPPYGTTKQGFETQFGVNHLGHFALTAAGEQTIAVAAHPGYTATGEQARTNELSLIDRLTKQGQPIGALPTLYAATAASVQGGNILDHRASVNYGANRTGLSRTRHHMICGLRSVCGRYLSSLQTAHLLFDHPFANDPIDG
ncbi:MAG: SDR family NAD(P)-dependent oxidoreductase [Chloroflexota bacterium]